MKKLFALLSILIYASTALGGIIVDFHYCKGHLDHISVLNFGSKAGCSCNPDAMPMHCCNDELLFIKADDHKTIQESYTFNSISFTHDLHPVNGLHTQVLRECVYDSENFYNGVMRTCPEPIYLLNRVFRI